MPKANGKGGAKKLTAKNKDEAKKLDLKESFELIQTDEIPKKGAKRQKGAPKTTKSPRKIGKMRNKEEKSLRKKTNIVFAEDDNIVEMETEGMATEFMSGEDSDEELDEEVQLAMQISRNNNATKVGESSKSGKGARRK